MLLTRGISHGIGYSSVQVGMSRKGSWGNLGNSCCPRAGVRKGRIAFLGPKGLGEGLRGHQTTKGYSQAGVTIDVPLRGEGSWAGNVPGAGGWTCIVQ